MSYDDKKWAHTAADIPQSEHYAIIYFSTIHIPGDERSRQCPGHGYPEHSEPKIEYVVFGSRKAWEAEIATLSAAPLHHSFRAINVRPAKVVTKVMTEIET